MKLNLHLYADANYGTNDGKSTTGGQLNMDGAFNLLPHAGPQRFSGCSRALYT